MTLKDVLIEASKSDELISAGTGKEISKFLKDVLFSKGGEAQLVKTADGNYDFYVADNPKASGLNRNKEYYIGTLENKWRDDIRAWYEACKAFINSEKVSDKMKEIIRADVNHKLNMDRYEKDREGKTWYKEI